MLLLGQTQILNSSRGTLLCQTRRLGLFAVLLLTLAGPLRAEKVSDLKHQGCVNDFARVLSSDAQSRITSLCNELFSRAGAALVVVTVRTVEGTPIEQFGVGLYQQWGIGKKGEDRGVLVLLAVEDRKYWTTVGYGLEPILPDGKVGGFGRDMRPFLQQGNYDRALLQISNQIASVIAQDRGVTLDNLGPATSAPSERSQDNHSGNHLGGLITLIIILAILGRGGFFLLSLLGLFNIGGRRRHGPWWWGSGFGGGGWSGGSWGGGGFGGAGGFGGFGGGSTGGGGAGGSW